MARDPQLVPAKVVGDNYHFRGKKIPKGRIVRVERSALEAAQRVNPPYLVAADATGAAAEELPAYQPPAEEASASAAKKKSS